MTKYDLSLDKSAEVVYTIMVNKAGLSVLTVRQC